MFSPSNTCFTPGLFGPTPTSLPFVKASQREELGGPRFRHLPTGHRSTAPRRAGGQGEGWRGCVRRREGSAGGYADVAGLEAGACQESDLDLYRSCGFNSSFPVKGTLQHTNTNTNTHTNTNTSTNRNTTTTHANTSTHANRNAQTQAHANTDTNTQTHTYEWMTRSSFARFDLTLLCRHCPCKPCSTFRQITCNQWEGLTQFTHDYS